MSSRHVVHLIAELSCCSIAKCALVLGQLCLHVDMLGDHLVVFVLVDAFLDSCL